MLQIVDAQWKDHLYSLDHLKEGIGLRGYGQRDPLVEYKKESFALFQDMKARIEEEIVRYLWWLRPVGRARRPRPCRPAAPAPRRQTSPSATTPAGSRRPAFGAGPRPAPGRSDGAAARPPARVGGDDAPDQDGEARGAEDRPQRSVLVRQRQEVQEVPRRMTA
jgi:preprotein translocase subunit SecA